MTPMITINGIGRRSYKTTTDRMAHRLVENYGRNVFPLRHKDTAWYNGRNRLRQYQDAYHMYHKVNHIYGFKPVDAVVHSHGGLLIARMMELASYPMFRRIIMFAPALDCDWIFTENGFEHMWVVSNPNDSAMLWSVIPWSHPWGNMGRKGFSDPVPPGIINRTQVWDDTRAWPRSHSHYFNDKHLPKWTEFVLSITE